MRIEDKIFFCTPARLIIESGCRHDVPKLIASLGYKSGLLVTDEFFVEKTPWVQEYIKNADAAGVKTKVFAGGMPDPTTSLCDEATVQIAMEMDGDLPDHVIALGGGSNIDLAKALCVTLPTGRSVKEFGNGVDSSVQVLPLIALPTTAGTGSEATPGTILFDPETGIKTAVMDNRLRPCVAAIDPEFTYTCPPKVTAESGIDALTHAIESYITLDSSMFNRKGSSDPGYSGRSSLTMVFAREAIDLCAKYLLRAYKNGGDTEARIGMCYASIYAAFSYGSAGLNAVHGIAYGVAAMTHKSHGATNAVVLPYVIDALREHRHTELLDVARMFGIQDGDEKVAVMKLPACLRNLVKSLGIPENLEAFGIAESQLSNLVSDALSVKRLADAFPVSNVEENYKSIITSAWTGQVALDALMSKAQKVSNDLTYTI